MAPPSMKHIQRVLDGEPLPEEVTIGFDLDA